MSTIVLSANGPDFLTWTGDCQGQQGRICTLPIDGPKTTLAVFADIPF